MDDLETEEVIQKDAQMFEEMKDYLIKIWDSV